MGLTGFNRARREQQKKAEQLDTARITNDVNLPNPVSQAETEEIKTKKETKKGK